MDKNQRKLIAKLADRLEDDGSVSESLYNYAVKRGKETIDQFIYAVETSFMDWEWNNKKFQELLKQIYRGKPPATPDQLAAELQKSQQDPGLKNTLIGLLSGPARQPAKSAQPAPPAQPAPTPASQAVKPPAPSAQQLNLMYHKEYTVVYENFQGRQLTFHNAKYVGQRGAHAIFECPRPARRPPPRWYRGRRIIITPQDIAERQKELAQLIAEQHVILQRLPNRRYRVNGRWFTLSQLRQSRPGWIKSIQRAEQNTRRSAQAINRSIQYNTTAMQTVKPDRIPPLRKSLRVDKIVSVK